jgi:hypothetical protein
MNKPTLHTGPQHTPAPTQPLSPQECRRLTLVKWRHTLGVALFSADEVERLAFAKWLYEQQRLHS